MAAISPLMTETTAAQMLAILPATMRRWRWAGRGPAFVKVGASVRYSPAALAAFIERGTVTSGGAADFVATDPFLSLLEALEAAPGSQGS